MPVYLQVASTVFFIFLVGCFLYFPYEYALMKHDRSWRNADNQDHFLVKVLVSVTIGLFCSLLWIVVLALLPLALIGYGVAKWTENRLDKKDQHV